jgi:hypothetical protein
MSFANCRQNQQRQKTINTLLTAEERCLLIRCVDGELSATRRMARSNFKDRTLAGLLRRAVSVSVSVSG